MNKARAALWGLVAAFGLGLAGPARAQFRDDFSGPLKLDPEGEKGWSYFSGEGRANMALVQDRRNVWWALVKRRVSDFLDLARLKDPGWELRVEARIRVSEAPRRVNLHFNTQKTVDFHTHLMEYDIPDTTAWHTISMTTRGFEAGPGDTVNAQMALMDWGQGRYRVDVDYFKVDVVETARSGPDLGDPVPYHPPLPDPGSFTHSARPVEEAVIDSANPDVNFRGWSALEGGGRTELLTVGGTQWVILRWDLGAWAGKKVSGPGLLEMTTRSVERIDPELPDFGLVRVVEVVGGDPGWSVATVTFGNLLRGLPLDRVILPQMIIDWPAADGPGDKTYFVISRPALQRLVAGRSLGLALRPLGALNASFFAGRGQSDTRGARLLFNIQE
jgi:hypothetical protein